MRQGKVYLIITLFVIIISLFFISRKPSVIFTCTTFFDFDKQDKWTAFCKAMDSILEQHTPETLQNIEKWFIVNEYSASPKANWVQKIQERYPFVEFVQKGPDQKGQAVSMNIILQKVKPYDYWIHWEETWYCVRPCIDRMVLAIQDTNISQIQATRHKGEVNWTNSVNHRQELLKTPSGVEIIRIYPSKDTYKYLNLSPHDVLQKGGLGHWPLYSLLPSINRVSLISKVGEFSTDPSLWPVKFEWEFAKRWFLAGGTKAVLPDGPVERNEAGHKSTYS